ncbi:hypothetical protein AgCh_014868 [Apium graveolens]
MYDQIPLDSTGASTLDNDLGKPRPTTTTTQSQRALPPWANTSGSELTIYKESSRKLASRADARKGSSLNHSHQTQAGHRRPSGTISHSGLSNLKINQDTDSTNSASRGIAVSFFLEAIKRSHGSTKEKIEGREIRDYSSRSDRLLVKDDERFVKVSGMSKHVEYEKMPGWQSDISSIRNYSDLPKAARDYVETIEELVGVLVHYIVLPVIKELMNSGISVWLYSGDTDGVVSVTTTRYDIDYLQTTVKTQWYPWYTKAEVGGYAIGYENLTFVTVRGSGHFVPSYRPSRALALFSSFLAGELPQTNVSNILNTSS